jgi:hypothetical protein
MSNNFATDGILLLIKDQGDKGGLSSYNRPSATRKVCTVKANKAGEIVEKVIPCQEG